MKKPVKLELDYSRENQKGEASHIVSVSAEAEVRRIAGLNLEQLHSHEIKLQEPEFAFETKSKSMISLGFMVKGFASSDYEGVPHLMEQSPMSFNVMYQAGLGAAHKMWGDDGFHFIHIGISNEKFMNLLTASPELSDHYAGIMAKESFYLYQGFKSPKMTPALVNALNDFRQIDFTNSLCGLLLESSLLSLIAHTHSQSFKEESVSKETSLMHDLKVFLDTHYLENITLKNLAKEFGINEYLIKNNFKKYYNTTVFSYLQHLRMVQAQEMLLSGMSIKEVSSVIGYEHPHHFSKAFTKWSGIKPSSLKS